MVKLTKSLILLKSIYLAIKLHKNQKYGEVSYFVGHIVPVLKRVYKMYGLQYDLLIVAALHDVIEDCGVDMAWLESKGIPHQLAFMVNILSKNKKTKYNDYLRLVASYKISYFVKYADMVCNYVSSVNANDIRRIDKYHNGIEVLHRYHVEIFGNNKYK